MTWPDVDERGFRPQHLQAPERLVLSPSEEDMEETVRTRLHFQQVTQKRVRQMEEDKENGLWSEARERGLQTQIETLRIATESVRELEGFDNRLGHILASSGFRVAGSGCVMDWGLIEVDEARVAGNIVSPPPLQELVEIMGCPLISRQ